MRWKEKLKPPQNSRKLVKRFAILPVKFYGTWVWLESYYIEYCYDNYTGWCPHWYFLKEHKPKSYDKN
jgi:hypothetical protein